MRIGILTFHFSHNVGSALQAFALRKYLISQGKEITCRVINYERRGWITPPHLIGSKSGVYRYLRRMIVYVLVKIRIKWFTRFQRKYCDLTKRIKRDDLVKLNNKYDMFVFGGDQIWCIENSKVDDTYFGDFVNDSNKKVSYAPSFGITHLPENKKEHIRDLLLTFKFISVREQSGQAIVEDLLGNKPVMVLDPVFLIGKDGYDEIDDSEVTTKGYCLCYVRDKNNGYTTEYAKKFSAQGNLKLNTIAGAELNGKHFPIIGPAAWLNLVKGANIIITNSFHAVCFSILFHKEFYVDANQKSTRVLNLLSMLGLEDRLLPLKDDCTIRPINWGKIDAIIESYKQKSEDYIKQAIFN